MMSYVIVPLAAHGVHVDGRYINEEESTEQVMHITRGYSRDHRPDLNPVMLKLMVEHQAGIVVLTQPLSDHSSDTTKFGQVVRESLAQW
jgi:transposase